MSDAQSCPSVRGLGWEPASGGCSGMFSGLDPLGGRMVAHWGHLYLVQLCVSGLGAPQTTAGGRQCCLPGASWFCVGTQVWPHKSRASALLTGPRTHPALSVLFWSFYTIKLKTSKNRGKAVSE